MNKKQKLLTILAAIGLIIFTSCSAVQDIIVPAYVDKDAAEWVDTTPKLFMPYTTLWDAKRIGTLLDYKFAQEKIKYGYYSSITNLSILAGEEIKATVFSPEGPVALLLPTLFGGTLGALLIKRPGDKSKKELNATYS